MTAPAPSLPAVPEAGRAACLAFSNWVEQYLAGQPAVGLPQGQALAWRRRETLLQLIQTHPEQALALAAPFRWRQGLPPAITRHFEQPVDGRGDLMVAVATDFLLGKSAVYREARISGKRYEAFVYGWRSSQVSQTQIPLHGIALDGQLAVQSDPIRLLERAEAAALDQERGQHASTVCGVCGRQAGFGPLAIAADTGGETVRFCTLEHAQVVNEQWIAGGGESGNRLTAASASGSWTQGLKTLLYMRVNFPDDLTEPISEADAYAVMDNVSAFYAEGSYDMTSLITLVTPLLTLPATKAWYSTAGPGALLDDAREVCHRAGFDTADFDLDIVCHTSVPGYDWGGLGYVHGKGTWLQSSGAGVTAHELGHNYGLFHANYWDTAANYSGFGAGTNLEYGNNFDTMGRAAAGANHFNAAFKHLLEWLPDTTVYDITNNGLYRLHAFDEPTREPGRGYAARVRKDSLRDYWLEFRQQFPSNPWLQNGVLLNWSPWAQSEGGTHLLDTTPGTLTPSRDSREDAAVVIGRTFSDLGAGVHITPVARGGSGPNAWIDVQVHSGVCPTNQPPVISVEVDPPNAAPGALVHFHVSATDPNGDPLAYAWTFDDGSFSTNNQPWTFKSWSRPGDHVVRCVVSDMKGGVASANALVTVGQPAGYRIRGRVVDVAGLPLEGVQVSTGAANPATYPGSYTDSQGYYLLVGATGDLNLNALKYGFTFTNWTWTNPISMSADWARVDFLALPQTAVSLVASTNAVPENSPATHTFTLTRTGSTNEDLTVTLYLSGSATLARDYRLSPELEVSTNTVVIPAGTNQVIFTLQPMNDTLAEGPEVVTLTLAADAAYVPGVPAEATVTILDDDLPSRPAVAVTALVSRVPENGFDGGRLVFSRTGSTQSELPIAYSVGGTATAGADYIRLLGVAVIPAGASSTAIDLQPIDDKLVEPDETVTVSLNASPAYTISGGTAQVTLVDDDVLTVTIAPTQAPAAEPAVPGRFTVKRDGDLSANLVVAYAVSGTATSGTDFAPLSGTVTIPAGAAAADIVLQVLDDKLVEGDETVTLTLTNNTCYDVGTPGSATIWIRDDEKPTISITATDAEASEPGEDCGSFKISRGSVTGGALPVYLAISGTAYNGFDYVPLDPVVVIPDGASSVTLDLIPFDDLHQEPPESVIINLLANTNYILGASDQARLTLLDDDGYNPPAVGFCFSASSALESQSPGICVSLSATSTIPITVDYRVIGGTAASADFSLPPPPLTFEPGEQVKFLPLSINNNATAQPDRTVRLALFNPIYATLDGIKIHTYTILDDDSAAVSLVATTAKAFETGPVPGNFRIARAGATNANLLVHFQVTGTASAPTDYAPLGTSVVIPAGAAFIDLPVVPVADRTVELDQTVVLKLVSAPGARIASPNSATVVITDNASDNLPVIAVTATNRPAAVEGGNNGEFVLWRNSTSGELTVHYSIGGTASAGTDFQPLLGEITIPNGVASVPFPVVPIDDTQVEGEETVVLTLTPWDTYRVAYPSAATVTLQDNDQRVRLDASDFVAAEPGNDLGEFTFTRFGTTNTGLRVFFTIGGTAGNGSDYAAISNSFVIPAGSLSATLPVVPLDDVLVEGPESLTLTLQPAPAYVLGDNTKGTVTIQDDEPMLTISATVSNAVEGSYRPGVFTITRTGDPKYDFTVRLAFGGTARSGLDYPSLETNVYFSCGVMARDLLVYPFHELAVEGAETIIAALMPDPSYTILSPSSALMTIEDAGNNQTPLVRITSPKGSPISLLGSNVNMILEASVSDDGPTNELTLLWSQESGPANVTFGVTNESNSTVSFTNSGVYVLRLTADDGQLQSMAQVTVVVDGAGFLASQSPSLHWPLDEGGGLNVYDFSGAGHNGALVGHPSWTTNGAVDGAVRLWGTNDYIREASGTNLLDGLREFSLGLWIQPAVSNVEQSIFCANDASSGVTLALASRIYASCGRATNVIELTFATTQGAYRYVSAADVLTNAWQHLFVSWTNGFAPELFINGALDQPLVHMLPWAGSLTNSPQFLVGKGPLGAPPAWNGWVDEVRLFSRALGGDGALVAAGCDEGNAGPIVKVGPDVTVQLLSPVVLAGEVSDDGRPVPPGALTNYWLQVSGPMEVTLTNINSLTNIVQLWQPGKYIFRLIADDDQVKIYDDIQVTVTEPTRVDVYAGDGDAAELGPDTGEFIVMRDGDLSYDLRVSLAMSGTASNRMDCVELTNVVFFPAGSNMVSLLVTPFLDHRTEGDETLTLTIVSNLAYSIGSGEATVIIHDSPYGVWTVNHFTLEELTDPTLSGEDADFDRDGVVNFVEYAANLNPKSPETNAPSAWAVEVNPADGRSYITLTYHRRLEPTDTDYTVLVSDDLYTWHSGANYVEELQTTDDGNYLTETVKARLKTPWSNTAASQFVTVRLRLRATGP